MRRGVPALLLLLLGLGSLVVCPARADDTRSWDLAEDQMTLDSISSRLQDLFRGKPRIYWDRGLRLETEGKSLDVHVGFEFQGDLIWYSDMDAEVEAAAGAKWLTTGILRRSRLYVEGFVLRYWYFRARFNWNLITEPSFQDLFVEYTGFRDRLSKWLPVIRLGQVKEPMTLDWMTGANWTTFAERAMVTSALAPDRSAGIRIHGAFFDRRMTYQAGFFAPNIQTLGDYRKGSGEAVTFRLTGLPWAPKDSPCRYVHLGFSGSIRWNVDELRLAALPGSAGGPNIVDTREFFASRAEVWAGEFIYSRDRLSLQAEAVWNRVKYPRGDDGHYWGWYTQASYFLTKPCRAYRRYMAAFGRVQPEGELFCKARRGPGAWEVAGRFSYLDLDDAPQKGGTAWTATLGLNWYARDNIRVTANVVYTSVAGAYGDAGADGTMTTLLLRFQYNL